MVLEKIKWDKFSFLKIKEDSSGVYITKDIVDFLKTIDIKGMAAIDGGCNIGVFSVYFSRMVGKHGKVYAFDIQKQMCDLAIQNAAKNKADNVAVINKALSNISGGSVGHTYIDYSGQNISSAGIKTEQKLNGMPHCGSVETIALDDMCIKNIGLIKLDLEGHERESLQGMRKTISEQHPFLILELSPGYMHGDENIVLKELSDMGYQTIKATDYNYFFTYHKCIV